MTKKPQAYPRRYVEDFFGVSNDVVTSAEALSEGGSRTIEMRNRKSFFTTLLGLRRSSLWDVLHVQLIDSTHERK
jgi:hypothetical protein